MSNSKTPMKAPLIAGLTLLVGGQLVWADDQNQAPPPRSHPRPPATAEVADAPRPAQTSARRSGVMPTNPNFRPVNPNAAAVGNYRGSPHHLISQRPDGVPTARPNGSVVNAGANRPRVPARTGNELSFAQARSQCKRQPHDRDWWRHHHGVVVFYGGGYWFWNSGWWFPAWGYDPFYNNYVYDGPIYGFGQLSPGDVTSQVQEALAQQGYYYGAIDGVLGPETRDAILRFQVDHGLANTAAIDEPTLNSLGLT